MCSPVFDTELADFSTGCLTRRSHAYVFIFPFVVKYAKFNEVIIIMRSYELKSLSAGPL